MMKDEDKILICRRCHDKNILKQGSFIESNCILYSYDKNNNLIQVCNFLVFIRNERVVFSENCEEWYVDIYLYYEYQSISFTVRRDDLSHLLYEQIHRQYPHLFISSDNGRNFAKFKEYVSILYGYYMKKRIVYDFYNFTGWQYTSGGIHYFSRLDNNCISHRCLCDVSMMPPQDVFKKGLKILDLAHLDVILPMYLQMHIGVLAQLFEEAGCPVRHILTISGVTGSRKTAVAKELFCNFELQTPMNFTATDSALEIMLSQSKDLNMLLDDLYAANDPQLLSKLQRLMRQYCDGIGRSRSCNWGQQIESRMFCCGLVMTAESNIENIQISSKRRLFIVPIDTNSVNNAELTFFQQNRENARFLHQFSWVEEYLSAFIKYVEINYYKITNLLRSYNPPYLNLSSDRLASTYRVFMATARVIVEWGIDIGIEEFRNEQILNKWGEIIINLTYYNERLCLQDEPYLLFLKAIEYGVAARELNIAQNKCQYETLISNFCGFIDKNIWKVDLHKCYDYAVKYSKGQGFVCSEKEIPKMLYEKGIIEVYTKPDRVCYMKSVRINGVDMPMLCIKRSKMKEVIS